MFFLKKIELIIIILYNIILMSFNYEDILFNKNINIRKELDLENCFYLGDTNSKKIYKYCEKKRINGQNVYNFKCFKCSNFIDGDKLEYYINSNIIIVKCYHENIANIYAIEISLPHDSLFLIKCIYKNTNQDRVDIVNMAQLFIQDPKKFNNTFMIGNIELNKIISLEDYKDLENIFVNKATNIWEEITQTDKIIEELPKIDINNFPAEDIYELFNEIDQSLDFLNNDFGILYSGFKSLRDKYNIK
jgi:hypothetical protein